MSDVDARTQTLASFDWQWAHLPSGDFMPGDPWFDANAARILATEMCGLAPEWFKGRRVLDAGCGRGRWTRALLELGATVTAVDYSEAGIAQTRALCGDTSRLRTMRVDLLAPPNDLLCQRFDLVFSYGVLHHTGDTWKALDNVSTLVGERGALCLYLYGAPSFSSESRRVLERVRQELGGLSFEDKMMELRRRFPADDPHQLFDLMSPLINDRLEFREVADRLRAGGFERIDRTIQSGEIYLRATREGFPEQVILPAAEGDHTFAAEISHRHAQRLGAAFEDSVRAALTNVNGPSRSIRLTRLLSEIPWGSSVLETSLSPDALPKGAAGDVPIRQWDGPSPATPGLQRRPADTVVHLGASLGTCRFPRICLSSLWEHVNPAGTLVVEVVAEGFSRPKRSFVDRVLDARVAVPGKLARMLARNPSWCSGEALNALGGESLLNPLDPESAATVLHSFAPASVVRLPTDRGTELLLARRA